MAAWTRADLLDAQRSGTKLDVIAPGIDGCTIEAVREDDIVVAAPFGRAYVALQSIRTPAPKRFPPGARVATPYGRGVVREFRAADDALSYVVAFVDKGATGASTTWSEAG